MLSWHAEFLIRSPENTVASAQIGRAALATHQNINLTPGLSPTSPRGPGSQQNPRTPPPYPSYCQHQSNTQVNLNTNSNVKSNQCPTGSPGLIERKTFRNDDDGQLDFLKAEHLCTLESTVGIATESSKSIDQQDWSGLDYKAGSQSLISLLSEGTGIRYPSQSLSDTITNLSDSGEDTDSEDEQSIINDFYPIDSKQS